jgi:hypothetical protein
MAAYEDAVTSTGMIPAEIRKAVQDMREIPDA